MADLEQGIKYTIEADASKAEKSLQDVGKSAAENGKKIEKAMAGANAVTQALNGNFVGAISSLGRMTRAVSGLGKVIASATGWVAIIGAVVGVFHKWREKIAETKAKLDEFKKVKFDEHIAAMKKAQEDLAKEIDKTVAAIDKQLDADTRALDIAKEKIKAQIELNRQKDLEGKSDAEKELINANANSDLSNVDRDFASKKIAAQIASQGGKTEALKKLLEEYSGIEKVDENGKKYTVGGWANTSWREYQESQKQVAQIRNDTLKNIVDEGLEKLRRSMRIKLEGGGMRLGTKEDVEPFREDYTKRALRSDKLKKALADNEDYKKALEKSEKLFSVYHAFAESEEKIKKAIADSEAKQKELAQQKEIDALKWKAGVLKDNETVLTTFDKFYANQDKKMFKADLDDWRKELEASKESEATAQSRLAAAQSAVQRAWGWYRDKDSMKAQLDEEKANAEAERQYEKDFEKLSYRRDWRTAKNLSVDQEATRRVALAKEEEAAAKKAVAETAANTKRAADAVEEIAKTIEEADNVD